MRLIFPRRPGSARILGKPISDVEMHRDIGYLPEQPYFYDYLTAAEVLGLFSRGFHDLNLPRTGKSAWKRMLKKVGLENRAEDTAAQVLKGDAATRGTWRKRFCTIRKW